MGNIAPMTAPDLTAAATVVDNAHSVVDTATRLLLVNGGPDENQVLAYDVAHAAATVETARAMLTYGAKGDLEGRIACAYVADAVGELVAKLFGREPADRAARDQGPASGEGCRTCPRVDRGRSP